MSRRMMPVSIFLFLTLPLFGEEREQMKPERYYFSLNPGANLVQESTHIEGHGFRGGMTHPERVSWALDLESTDIVLYHGQEYQAGSYMLVHATPLDFTHQEYEATYSSSPFSPNEAPSSTSMASEVEFKNVGTRLRGYYGYAVPAFYFANKGWGGLRLGLGAGVGSVWMSGTMDTMDKAAPLILIAGPPSATKADGLRDLGLYHLFSGLVGLTTDPVRSYFLYNLSEPGMLENYALYAMARGWTRGVGKYDYTMLYLLNRYYPYRLSDLEVIGLLSLQRSSVEIKKDHMTVVLLFFEMPVTKWFKFKASLGGPVFRSHGYRYDISTLDIAFFAPLHI